MNKIQIAFNGIIVLFCCGISISSFSQKTPGDVKIQAAKPKDKTVTKTVSGDELDKLAVSNQLEYSISLQEVKVNNIPDSVFKLTNLKSLKIEGTDCIALFEEGNNDKNCYKLKEIPKEIFQLKKLEILKLKFNAVRNIPMEIISLQNLKEINFSANDSLQNIERLIGLKNLEELNLSYCGLSKLPQSIGSLKKLKTLTLVSNNFSDDEKKRIINSLPKCKVIFEY